MVDPVGPRPVKPSDSVAAVTRASATQRPPQDSTTDLEPHSARITAKELAAKPPVDAMRVDALRRRIADGSYRIDASAIADRMLAMKSEWVANDPA
ncbi:flagellar biosynthesis anti-sigma factor FlgM [Sphingomonas aestuarii]|jgi:negative regulator of flagellin synthesis FlgM